MFPAVTCAIPGARRAEQVEENVAAADLPAITNSSMANVLDLYRREIRPLVHHYW
jgi:aryl-alcohol dehydrogenase-like predicted oxidoreductase